MSKYSAMDAHSRTCPSCIKQREAENSQSGGRKKSGPTCGKKSSLPDDKKSDLLSVTKKSDLPCDKKGSFLMRSNSCLSSLSSASMVGSREKAMKREDSFDGNTYLTPTQRKNQELKKCKADLAKASESLEIKDQEIIKLRRELYVTKEAKQEKMNTSWCEHQDTETGSVTDSGHCEELSDFELMESTLKEEEEVKQKLEQENMQLRDELYQKSKELELFGESATTQLEEMENRYRLQIEMLEHDCLRRLKEHELHLEECSSRLEERNHQQCEVVEVDKMIRNNIEKEVREQVEEEMKALYAKEFIEKNKLDSLAKEKSEKFESVVSELATSSLRCARQQDLIEQQQQRLEAASRQIEKTSQWNNASDNVNPPTIDTGNNLEKNTANLAIDSSATMSTEVLCLSQPATTSTVTDRSCQTEGGLQEVNLQEDSIDTSTHYTLQFLRRSVYYFLTDKENRDYHLKSIERLLEFNERERCLISTGRSGMSKTGRY